MDADPNPDAVALVGDAASVFFGRMLEADIARRRPGLPQLVGTRKAEIAREHWRFGTVLCTKPPGTPNRVSRGAEPAWTVTACTGRSRTWPSGPPRTGVVPGRSSL